MRSQGVREPIGRWALMLVIAALIAAQSASAQTATPPSVSAPQPSSGASPQPSTPDQLPATAPAPAQSCIALVSPTVAGVPGNAADAATGVRDLMASYLQGPSTKIVALEAKLVLQAVAEAKQKGCQPLLVVLTRKPGSSHGVLKALGRGAGASSWTLPGGGSTASTVAHAGATAGLQAVSSLAESTKAKDEMRLEYRLQSTEGQVLLAQTDHQTAKTDGEDLLTPLVRRAAEAIVSRNAMKR